MPEGDTIWRTARRLHDGLSGAAVTRAELRVPRFAAVELAGDTVDEVVARGKHILFRFASERTLHTHLGMDGYWRQHQPGSRWPGVRTPARAVLETTRTLAVGYRLARVDVVATKDENRLVGHLGPDLLGDDWDPDEAVRRLRAEPRRSIGDALLDQRSLAGIGNVYRAELLFVRGIDPWAPVAAVPELDRVVHLAREMLTANRDRSGHVTTGNRAPGRRNWVYGREGERCRRCGATIERATIGAAGLERSVWWCPSCQPKASSAAVAGESPASRPAT